MNPRVNQWLAAGAACLLLVACADGSSTSTSTSPSTTSSPSVADSPSPSDTPVGPALDTPTPVEPPPPSPARTGSVCGDPTAHVYHPYRLVLKNPCLTVSGTIMAIRSEPDGDYHVLLQLDAPYANLVNDKNAQYEHGDLVMEPVCEHMITQADATYACVGFNNTLVLPGVGLHVVATGAYVVDTLHGWTELHPLWAVHAG